MITVGRNPDKFLKKYFKNRDCRTEIYVDELISFRFSKPNVSIDSFTEYLSTPEVGKIEYALIITSDYSSEIPQSYVGLKKRKLHLIAEEGIKVDESMFENVLYYKIDDELKSYNMATSFAHELNSRSIKATVLFHEENFFKSVACAYSEMSHISIDVVNPQRCINLNPEKLRDQETMEMILAIKENEEKIGEFRNKSLFENAKLTDNSLRLNVGKILDCYLDEDFINEDDIIDEMEATVDMFRATDCFHMVQRFLLNVSNVVPISGKNYHLVNHSQVHTVLKGFFFNTDLMEKVAISIFSYGLFKPAKYYKKKLRRWCTMGEVMNEPLEMDMLISHEDSRKICFGSFLDLPGFLNMRTDVSVRNQIKYTSTRKKIKEEKKRDDNVMEEFVRIFNEKPIRNRISFSPAKVVKRSTRIVRCEQNLEKAFRINN